MFLAERVLELVHNAFLSNGMFTSWLKCVLENAIAADIRVLSKTPKAIVRPLRQQIYDNGNKSSRQLDQKLGNEPGR